LFVLVSSYVC